MWPRRSSSSSCRSRLTCLLQEEEEWKKCWGAMRLSCVLLVAGLVCGVGANNSSDNADDDHVRVRVKESPKPIAEYDLVHNHLIVRDSFRGIVLESEILNVEVDEANLTSVSTPISTRTSSALECGGSNPSGRPGRVQVANRIIGGHKVEPGQLPFQVRLNIRSRRRPGLCGGVLLDERHILTAAHCVSACAELAHTPLAWWQLATVSVESSSVVATLGDHSLLRPDDGDQALQVRRIVRHERYDACSPEASPHDIALLELSQPIQFRFTRDGYGSINRPCLPDRADLVYPEQQQVFVSGWGVTSEHSSHLSSVLRQVELALVPMRRCQEAYGASTKISAAGQVCAGHQRAGRDSCQGDSGGPLVRLTRGGNRYELVGIVSFGQGCGRPETPGVYTRVASYLDWIKANL